ncbi:LolA family protein [Halobacillus salinus]|uniref:DUF4367 domain-containing protein n=1 Tax=Halobacillus salinus TaxID=192814 RepID=A0A4Z0GVT8_9BACI|nr:DUF4367 domain-containing protein [Halobacillus salinus]TGB01407.1 DUF4367 domain-containing protein [Halobacillus salinus]
MKKLWMSTLVISCGLVLGACSAEEAANYSPDQIVAKAVAKESAVKGFHMKGQMEVFKGEEQIDDSTIEQWTDNENNKTKIITEAANGDISKTLNDGEKIISYSALQDAAFEMDAPETEEGAATQSQRAQIERRLEQTRETHNVELIGEEKWNGFDTYHIKAVPKEEGEGLTGIEEYWLTTEDWFIVKSVTESKDMKVNYSVSELEINPEFDASTFEIELPEDVEVKPFEEMNPSTEVTLEEAASDYGKPLLTVKNDSYNVERIESFYMQSFDRTEVSQEFHKDGFLQFTLSSFESPDESLSMGLGEEEELEVRGTDAVYSEDVITNLVWDENGLRYSLLVQNPEISKEQLLKIVENLQPVNE